MHKQKKLTPSLLGFTSNFAGDCICVPPARLPRRLQHIHTYLAWPCIGLRAVCNHVSVSLPPLSALLGGFWMGTAGWFGVSCHRGGGSQVEQETHIVAWVAPHGSSTLWPWPPRASSQPLSAPTIRGWCFAAHSQIFSASRRHSRPAMTRNPNPPYSPSTPLLGCLGGCSTFTHTWPGHVLVCALFVIMYLCYTDFELQRVANRKKMYVYIVGRIGLVVLYSSMQYCYCTSSSPAMLFLPAGRTSSIRTCHQEVRVP